MAGIDLPLRPQRRQVDHQEVERGHGHHARYHHGGEAAQLQQLADWNEIAGIVRARARRCGAHQQRDRHARRGEREPDREQSTGGRHRGRAAEPAHHERPRPLADRGRHHVIAEHALAAARAAGADCQHLVAGHAEHVAEAEQHAVADEMHRRARPGPEADAGDEDERRAEPDRPGVVAAIDPAPDLQRGERRDDGEAGGDDAEPDQGKAELQGPVGGGDPQHQDQRLGQHHVGEERGEQAEVDVLAAPARLLRHRRIVSRARTRFGRGSVATICLPAGAGDAMGAEGLLDEAAQCRAWPAGVLETSNEVLPMSRPNGVLSIRRVSQHSTVGSLYIEPGRARQ